MVVTAARAFRSLFFAVVGVGADGLFVCNYVPYALYRTNTWVVFEPSPYIILFYHHLLSDFLGRGLPMIWYR